MIEVLQAFKDGKEIQVELTPVNGGAWATAKTPNWNFFDNKYRIKPQPEYVPFTWEDRDLFRDKWIRVKGCMPESKVISFSYEGIYLNGGKLISYEELFKGCEFIDGAPFGKLKQ